MKKVETNTPGKLKMKPKKKGGKGDGFVYHDEISFFPLSPFPPFPLFPISLNHTYQCTPGGFTDIMDELAHTLGRLRGEILDETPEKELKAISEAPIGLYHTTSSLLCMSCSIRPLVK